MESKIFLNKGTLIDYDIYRLYRDILYFKRNADQRGDIIYIQTHRISYFNNKYKFRVRYLIDRTKRKIIYLKIDDEILTKYV